MEHSWRAAPLAGLLVVLTLVASGCAPARPATSPDAGANAVTPPPAGGTDVVARYRRTGQQAAGVSSGPIARFGAALSLTGAARMTGMVQRSGIKLAQDEINASGMLGKTRLEVVVDDDASDREQAAAVYQRFIEDSHVVAILGPTLSDTAQSVDPIAQQAAVPVLAISNSASGITQIGNFIFRGNLSESQLTPQVISAVRSRMKLHRAALLYSDTDANRSGSHGFKTGLENAGVHIASEQTFAKDQTDFSSQLEDIAASQPDALFVTAPSSAAAAILIQARQSSPALQKLPIIGSSAFNSDAVLRSAGDSAEGLIVGSGWTLSGQSARNQQFVQAYRQRYGVDPDQVAAQAYTGVYILANALKVANTASDARAVRDALEQTHALPTPLGDFSFNDAHDPDYAATVQVVHQGRFQAY
ncbi:MAG: ABC transporter substrate-binding protein [Chloroflexi bacterium]|nr:ABC transporter substrate-binding protein [Chloroflexota bacterium]